MPSASARRQSPPIVAFFTANPSSTTPLDLEGEVRAIAAELDAMGLEGLLQFEHHRATTPNDLQRVMLSSRPTIVQFSGHGLANHPAASRQRSRSTRDLVAEPVSEPGGIMLHGDRGAAVKTVSGRALGDLFAKVGSTVQLVFLNACHSAAQAQAIVDHVGFVIGLDGAIRDEAARVFAVALYRALALGQTIAKAFDLGVNALMLEGLDDDVELPVLRAHRGADPRKTRLVAAPKADDGVTWDVFVSYAHADRAEVHPLALALHQRHFRVFFDEWEITPGEVSVRRLEQGVEGSTHGLLAISPRTMAQPWVQQEYIALLDKAVTESRLLIPVLIGRGDAKLPLFLRTRHPVDLRGLTQEALREQVGVIARALRGQRPGPPPRTAGLPTREPVGAAIPTPRSARPGPPPRTTGLPPRAQPSSGSRRSTARKPK